MSLRGAKRLQTAALALYAAALGAMLLYIPTQSFWKRLATDDPDVLSCVTVPVAALFGAALHLALAAVWLACLRSRKDRPRRASVAVLAILLGAYSIAVEPVLSLAETLFLGRMGGVYVASAGAGNSLLNLAAGLPSSAAYILMLLSMGGGYGKTAPGGQCPEGAAEGKATSPLRGARTLQTVAFALFAAALALTVLYIPTQSAWKSVYSLSPDALSYRTVPVSYLIGGLFRFTAAAVWLAVLRGAYGRPRTSSVTALAILLGAYSIAISPLAGLAESLIAANGGTARFVSLTAANALLGYAAGLPSSAAYLLMLLSMGMGYGKAEMREKPAQSGGQGETRS